MKQQPRAWSWKGISSGLRLTFQQRLKIINFHSPIAIAREVDPHKVDLRFVCSSNASVSLLINSNADYGVARGFCQGRPASPPILVVGIPLGTPGASLMYLVILLLFLMSAYVKWQFLLQVDVVPWHVWWMKFPFLSFSSRESTDLGGALLFPLLKSDRLVESISAM